MPYMNPTPNPSGAYPAPQSHPAPGLIPLTEEQAATVLEYNGFVTITSEEEVIEDDDVPLTPPPAGPSEDIPDEDVPLVSPPQTGRRPAAELFAMAAGCAVVLIGWKKRK